MKCLITGGAGFVGSNLASLLLQKGAEVHIFDSLARDGAAENLTWLQTLGLKHLIHGDIRNAFDVERNIRDLKPDVMFHLAGQVAMTSSLQNPRRDFEIN